MLVSAILLLLLVAGGYALFVWLRQYQSAQATASREGRRSLTPERDRSIQPIELSPKSRPEPGTEPFELQRVSAPRVSSAPRPSEPRAVDLRPPEPVRSGRPTPRQGSDSGELEGRRRAVTQSEVIVLQPNQRKVRRRDPTVQLTPEELMSIIVDDEGTTLAIDQAREAAQNKVMLTSEFDITTEFGSNPEVVPEDELSGPVMPLTVWAGGSTHVGRKRKHNEDALLVLEDQGVFVIADGMGGYAAGEVASQMCVDTIRQSFETRTFTFPRTPALPPLGDELVRAIQASNVAILTESRSNEARAGMGTTVVSARFVPNRQRVYIAHVGDSRLYRVRGEELVQLTADHTLGAAGVTGPAAQKLSRAVGVFDEIEVDLNVDAPRYGDVYLLCSDGLFKMVHELRIVEILGEHADPHAAAKALVDEANARGGKDNISVIVLRVMDPRGSA